MSEFLMKYGLLYALPQLSKFNLGITGVEGEEEIAKEVVITILTYCLSSL